MLTGTVLIHLDDVVEIARYHFPIARRIAHDMLDTAVTVAVNNARQTGEAVVLRAHEWQRLSQIFGGDIAVVKAVEAHVYPRDDEKLVTDSAIIGPKQFWVHWSYDQPSFSATLNLRYITPHS